MSDTTSKPEKGELAVTSPRFTLVPKSLTEAVQYAELIAKSSICPPQFANEPGDVLVAMQMGFEVGLNPMQALQNIAVINSRPCLWGDALLGLVQASGQLEYIDEQDDGNKATCRLKRRGQPKELIRTFSMEEAKAAGLAGKQGPWQSYPKRMRQMRARAWALRDGFADVLKGLQVAEEVSDYEPVVLIDQPDGRPSAEVQMPRRASDVAKETPPEAPKPPANPTPTEEKGHSEGDDFASQKLGKEEQAVIYDELKLAGKSKAQLTMFLKNMFKLTDLAQVTVAQSDQVRTWIAQKELGM